MKFIKKFESYKSEDILNSILDKILRWGIESLTGTEKKFLDDIDNDELKDKISKRKEFTSSMFDYDPRSDDFFKDSELFDFDEFDDEDIEEGRWEIIYNELDDEDIISFENVYKLDIKLDSGGHKPRHQVSELEKEKFKEYVMGDME